MKTVQVLMSTYNGEKYLIRQLESILSQRGVKVCLLIRDDNSGDGTRKILAEYERAYHNISVYTGSRLGASRSFYDLLTHAGTRSDYYAFADQDDVWLEDKLARAAALLEKEPQYVPLLYAGSVIYASGDLRKQERMRCKRSREAAFGNALLENICMGCTQVFNRELLLLAREHLPAEDVMHDWWMYLTAAYFGKVRYDCHARILYRQHENNEVGMQNRWWKRWLNRLWHAGQLKHKLSRQAEAFRDAYEQLLTEEHPSQLLELMCGYRKSSKKKLRLVMSGKVYRQNRFDDAVCRLLLMIGFL